MRKKRIKLANSCNESGRFSLPRAGEAFHFREAVLVPSFTPFWGKSLMDLASRTSSKKVQLEALRRQESKQRIADIKKQQEEECVAALICIHGLAIDCFACASAAKPVMSRFLQPPVLVMNHLHCISSLLVRLTKSTLTWCVKAYFLVLARCGSAFASVVARKQGILADLCTS